MHPNVEHSGQSSSDNRQQQQQHGRINGQESTSSKSNDSKPENSRVVESDAVPRPRMRINANIAIEDTLVHMDKLHQREIQTHNDNIRERNGLQRFLRETFELQQQGHSDAFKEHNSKLKNERDELQRQVKVQDEVQKLQKKSQQELRHAGNSDQPDPIVVSTSALTPHMADGVSGQDLIQGMKQSNDEIYQFAALLAEEFLQGERRNDLPCTSVLQARARQELEVTRVFARNADAISEADIMTKLVSLNDFVYQIASAIAVAHENGIIRVSTDTSSEKAVQFFGESFCKLVMCVKRQPTHLRVSVSLQAYMNHFCTMVLCSEFSSIANREGTKILQQIFNVMKVSQPKAVSARWRALAYAQNQVLTQDQQNLFQLLGDGIRMLYGFPKKEFEFMFGGKLSELVRMTLELRKMIYGDYVAGDVEVFSPLPESEFDPEKMQVDDPSRNPPAGPILCTVTMGITRRLYIRRLQDDKWVNKVEYDILSKANVTMSFDDLM